MVLMSVRFPANPFLVHILMGNATTNQTLAMMAMANEELLIKQSTPQN